MITIDKLTYIADGMTILNNVTVSFEAGKLTAVIGKNGSGKSTLARHINALYLPQSGTVTIDGLITSDKKNLKAIRTSVGMVFQDPAAQAVAAVVEDDIAFAPENMGCTPEETENRIEYALAAVGIEHLRHRNITTLSGGERQAAAIAGVLAMKPRYIIFDEATSMLDSQTRTRIFTLGKSLANDGLGIIWITQNMDEAHSADKVICMEDINV